MKKVLLGFLFLANTVCAVEVVSSVGGEVLHTRDTDGNIMFREQVDGWANKSTDKKQLGVRLTTSQYSNLIRSHNTTAISVLADYKIDDLRVMGNLGIGNMSSDVFLFGDMVLSKQVNRSTEVFAGINGDVVDSVRGLDSSIVYRGVYAGFDWYTDSVGATMTVRHTDFTNNNTQSGWSGKAYANVVDGVNIYVSTRQYTNSSPYNGFYYSPEDYKRYNLGIGFRQRIKGYLVSGFAEFGRLVADGEWGRASAGRIAVETPKVANKPIFGIAAGTDLSNASGYRYDYARVYARFDF